MKAQGKAHKYGDNIDTDIIIPARYLNTADSRELAAHCMDSRRAGGVRPGRQEAVCRHWPYASDTAPSVYACVTDTVGEQAELAG